ncbi:CD9 antigen-like [Haliotis rubra]|uniref:CD9 antigen-like n=1 Tax=Haliotis rubra TaxID=36100 RepID=UPI001EE52730|nr:CD9 antigen-like [Haliotis rubra]
MCLGGKIDNIKYLMYAFNILFMVLGLGLIGFGIWLRLGPVTGKYIDEAYNFNALYIPAYVFIAIGAVMFVIGNIGICGAIRKKQQLLIVFFISLFVFFAILLVTGIIVLTERSPLRDAFRDHLQSKVKAFNNQDAQTYMDNFQNTFNCCGGERGVFDYRIINITTDNCTPENHYKPCADEYIKQLTPDVVLTIGVAFGAAAVMVLGMSLSLIFSCVIRRAGY